MQIQENISLKPFNTFGIDVNGRYFSKFSNTEELSDLLTYSSRLTSPIGKLSTFILGGGSNILFTRDYDGIILKNEIAGIEKLREDKDHYYIRVGAGENWHQFVLHCINNNWAGVENLSLIPGNAGAAPIQNIGAYGMELQNVFHELTAFHLKQKSNHTFGLNECEFGYRDSVFKNKYRDQFVITSLTLRLNKNPVYQTSYGAVAQELEKLNVEELSIKAISQAIINIRTSKLPDPAQIGNAGSFFKNPQISKQNFRLLSEKFTGLPSYPFNDNYVKIPAAWLIEQCGPDINGTSWKGFRRGDAGCHPNQALVLVNYRNASGKEIDDLAEEIKKSVQKKFGVELDKEVNII